MSTVQAKDPHFHPEVAITVYWLGRVAVHTYEGPKIDQSAFSALVHNQHRHREHIVSDGQLRKDSSCSWESSSHDHASAREARTSHGSLKENCDAGPRHVRDDSYDSYTSYGKGSEDSIDESVFEVDENGMPIPRYSSSSGPNRSRDGTGRGESTMYSDKNRSLYRSSPDLSHSSLSNRRSSSTDSTDSSHYGGGHSRQSSDSVEYPTRRSSMQLPGRKTSVSADPLQFIKVKGATDMALTAEEQMKQAAETKKLKFSGSISEDDSTDWQSNLNSWKNRRKSQSEKSYQLKEELEQMEREKEEPKTVATAVTKTFSQMKEERERRKSVPMSTKHFYPIEDEGEDDIFAPVQSEQQHSSPAPRTSSRFQSSATAREEVKETKYSTAKDSAAKWAQDSASKEEEEKDDRKTESQTTRLSRDTPDTSALRTRRSGVPDYRLSDSRDTWSKSRTDANQESASKENNRNSANNMSLSSKSSNKISNILRSFEQKEEKPKPKPTVDNVGDFRARQQSFEKYGARSSGVGSYRSWNSDRDKVPTRSSARSEVSQVTSSTVYASSKTSGKDYVEKNIKISQKANKDKGFGFTLSGGADRKQPVVVEKVGLGSAADVCELQTKDEVTAINGQSIVGLTSAELDQKVKDAVRVGQIELKVKRFLGSGDDFEDDEDFVSTDEEIDTPSRSISKSSSVRAENSFDSLDSRDDHQKPEVEQEKWREEENSSPGITPQSTRRGDPTSTSSDSGYDAQTFSPYHRGDNSSNEEEISMPQPQTKVRERPSLAARTRHLYHGDEDEETDLYLPNTVPGRNEDYSYQPREREVLSSQQIEVESRPSITIRRERINDFAQSAEEDDSKPLATSEAHIEEKPRDLKNGDSSDGGPPAALLKWQRQRPRVDYTFESDEQPEFYDQLKFSSSLSRRSEKPTEPEERNLQRASEDYSSTVHTQPPLTSSRRTFNLGEERRRMQDWNQTLEDERQPAEQLPSGNSENAVEVTFPFDQRRFATEREQMQQQYQTDLQRAADMERKNQEEERQMLEPELEKTRLLEERRAQRQARLQMYAQEATAGNDFEQPQHTSTFTTQIQGGRANTGRSEMLVIDARNRGGDDGQPMKVPTAGQPYQFQVKINSRETPQGLLIQPEMIPAQHSAPPQPDHAAFLEAERERIRQEEKQKIEAERRQKEEEEVRQIRNKEEQLRQQEEMLRRQQEELRKKEEELEKQKQQLQQMPPPPPRHSQQPDSSPNASYDSLQFETVTSKVRGGSPAYRSTVSAGPRRSEARPQASGSYSDRSQNAGSYSDRGRDGYNVRRSEPSWNGSGSQNSSWRGSSQPSVSSSQSSLPRWPPSSSGNDQGRGSSTQGASPGQYSREDMLAMNRRATPLQSKPPSMSPTSPPADQPEVSSPIKREAPSKGQLHSLNSVPKAKFRNPDQWISDEPSYPQRGSTSSNSSGEGRSQPTAAPRRSEVNRSGNFRSQFAGQDHWLVQEAERRRMNDAGQVQGPSRAQFSGPIKPASDDYRNHWRGENSDVPRSPNMPAQIRQTLLQKTAGARGSTASNSSQDSNPPQPAPYSHSYPSHNLSETLPPNFGYGSGYSHSPRSDLVPPQHRAPSPEDHRENGVPVSGKQRCSHCSQELGFGAAMVIESLGLYYHTQCFKCCVCRTPLGNGVEGADVRVRVNKLHCQNCYSNDEAGLKFSKV